MRKILIIAIIVLLVILLFPFQIRKLKDGGSIEFNALLYSVTKYHKLAPENSGKEYIDGIGIKLLGKEIFISANIEKETGIEVENTKNSSFVGTILEETTKYMIVKPNEDEEEIKSADKIEINYGKDYRDYLFGVGRKVLIYYDGQIMETYPAKINADKILIDGYEEFELKVKVADKKRAIKILKNKDIYKNNPDYDLYYYGLEEVNILVDNKTMPLKEALKTGKITIEGIIQKANQDESNGVIESQAYDDGGTTEWYYDNYTIIKCHSLDGNRDVYIGNPEMRLKDVF